MASEAGQSIADDGNNKCKGMNTKRTGYLYSKYAGCTEDCENMGNTPINKLQTKTRRHFMR